MISQEQADDIRLFLIAQLEQYGFGDITREVTIRIEEQFEDDTYDKSPRGMLNDFLIQSIDIFETLSNNNYEALIGRFREYVESDGGIETVYVQPFLNSKDRFDLRELPDYKHIIVELNEIRYLMMEGN